MPSPYNQTPNPSSPLGQETGLLYSPDPSVTKKVGLLKGCIICVYIVQICHFLHPLHTYKSTFVYVMRGGMELPAFLLLSSDYT